MSVSTVITLGYGSFGVVNYIPTLGYGDYGGTSPTPEPDGVKHYPHPAKRKSHYPLRVLYGREVYYVHGEAEERALLESLYARQEEPKRRKKTKKIKVYLEEEPDAEPLVLSRLEPDAALFTQLLELRDLELAKIAAEQADEEAMMVMLGMIL